MPHYKLRLSQTINNVSIMYSVTWRVDGDLRAQTNASLILTVSTLESAFSRVRVLVDLKRKTLSSFDTLEAPLFRPLQEGFVFAWLSFMRNSCEEVVVNRRVHLIPLCNKKCWQTRRRSKLIFILWQEIFFACLFVFLIPERHPSQGEVKQQS